MIPGAPADPTLIDQFAAQVGAVPRTLLYWASWGDNTRFDPAVANVAVARGAVPLLAWSPHDSSLPIDQPDYADAVIAGGRYDPYIRAWADDIARWGKPFYLDFAHEMNGDWYSWSPGVNGNSAADFQAMWRHVHDIFGQEGAANVRFVWCVNVTESGRYPFASLYPGDAYVDWLGLDGYNFGTSQSWSHWESPTTVFGASYAALTRLSGRPIIVVEVGCVELGGDKAAWIRELYLTDIPTLYPRIRAVVWFDEDKSGQGLGEANWRIDTSSAALAAYREAVASPRYRGILP